jgi:integrase
MSAKIHFYIRTERPRKDGAVQIFLLFVINRRQRLKISTGKYISLKREYQNLNAEQLSKVGITKKEDLFYWDSSKERAIKGTANWEEINTYLDAEKDKTNKVLSKYESMNKPISLALFKKAYLKPNGTNIFKDYFLAELEGRKHLIANDTYRGYKATINKVNDFKDNITLADIDYKFLSSFENHMLKPIKEKGLGNIPSTVSKTMRMVRALIQIAMKNEDFLREAYPFKDYKIKHIDPLLTTRDYLEPDDLLKIEQLLSPENITELTPYQIKATQRFLFACYTGLRFSDVNNLNWEQHIFSKYVFNPTTKKMVLRTYIDLQMSKTSHRVLIPLIDKALEIMGNRTNGSVFEKISNQKINKHLKFVNTKAKLKKKLSFHVARHSFATICFLYGIPEKVGQKLLGHKNRKFTEVYTHLSQSNHPNELGKEGRLTS